MIYSKDGEVIPIDKGTDEDKRVVGNGLPKFTMSVTHTFRYKKFRFEFVFPMVILGYQIYDVHDCIMAAGCSSEYECAGVRLQGK